VSSRCQFNRKYDRARELAVGLTKKQTAPGGDPKISPRGLLKGAGDGLLSRELSPGVPSALSGLTTVFGMGTGVALTL
jgi:hypothetical protein